MKSTIDYKLIDKIINRKRDKMLADNKLYGEQRIFSHVLKLTKSINKAKSYFKYLCYKKWQVNKIAWRYERERKRYLDRLQDIDYIDYRKQYNKEYHLLTYEPKGIIKRKYIKAVN